MIQVFEEMNIYGAQRVPFFFMINFEGTAGEVYPLRELPNSIQYDFTGKVDGSNDIPTFQFKKDPIEKETYAKGFNQVMKEILYGNSFLLNLAYASNIETNLSLESIYKYAHAKYKVYKQGVFTCFSPETFVQIEQNKIASFPMKGTIDASIPNAEQLILDDEKEKAEHYTIVDLIRNDLAMVSNHIQVPKFRYIDLIETHDRNLLQVSSKVVGTLDLNWQDRIGTIFQTLLPAGSISGAPKKKTVEIIQAAEIEPRGYYTGIAGVFDGESVDSGVMIRFVESTEHGMRYRSGGGITHQSTLDQEYQELIDKVYVPIF